MDNFFVTQNASSYTHEYSQFPYHIILQHNYKDADDSIALLINEIESLKERGLYDVASKMIDDNADILAHYNINCETINTIEEEIRNAQIMAIQKHQCVYTQDDEPDVCCVGDIWDGGL